MIFELCPTLSRDLIKREFLNTAAAFGVLVLLGFAAGMLFPDMAQQILQNFAAQIEQLGLTDDVPQSQMMATLFFNNITASLLSMLYGLIPARSPPSISSRASVSVCMFSAFCPTAFLSCPR